MNPNDPENSITICGKTTTAWLHEICQKTSWMVKPIEEDLRKVPQEKPSFKVILQVYNLKDGDLINFGEGFASSKKLAKHRASFALLHKMGYTKEKLAEIRLQPNNKGEIPAEKMKDGGESKEPPLIQDNEEYVSRLKQVCADRGLPDPIIKVVKVTGLSNNALITVSGEIPRRGIIMDRIFHVVEKYGKHKAIKHVVAKELLKQVYAQENKIFVSVIEWANECEANTLELSENFINSVTDKDPLQGFDFEKLRLKECHLLNKKNSFAHDLQSFQTTFKSSRLELAVKGEQLFEDPSELLADIVQEQSLNGHFCKREFTLICDQVNCGLASVKLVFESWVFSFHGQGTSLELATRDAAKHALIFLKNICESEHSAAPGS